MVFVVGAQEWVLVRVLDYFDDVLVCAVEDCFEFLDDLVVVVYWFVELLQVVVDDEDQVV